MGLTINDSMSWKSHIDTILPRLSSACFAMRTIKPYFSYQTLKVIYYANFHAIMSYGINGKAKQLIESYLSNRYQRVILKKIQEQTPMWSQNGKVSSTESPRAQYWAPCFFCYTSMTCQRQSHLGQFQYNLQTILVF